MESLQATMKAKFDHSAETGVKIGFKLPDGNKTEHVFTSSSTVKVYIQECLCDVMHL